MSVIDLLDHLPLIVSAFLVFYIAKKKYKQRNGEFIEFVQKSKTAYLYTLVLLILLLVPVVLIYIAFALKGKASWVDVIQISVIVSIALMIVTVLYYLIFKKSPRK